MEIYAETLIVELTRKCNMNCPHCLRGDAQNLVMSKDTICKILDNVSGIETVVFSGGEPSLYYDLIDFFFEEAQRKRKLPCAFWLATNGKQNQLELATTLLKWYPQMVFPDICGVALSIDEYHEKSDTPEFIKGLAFYDKCKEQSGNDWLIECEKTIENDLLSRKREFKPEFYLDSINDNSCSIETLYVSANENIIGSCDFSYKEIDKKHITTLDELHSYIENHI